MITCRTPGCGNQPDRVLKDGHCLRCNKTRSISKEMLFQTFTTVRKVLGEDLIQRNEEASKWFENTKRLEKWINGDWPI